MSVNDESKFKNKKIAEYVEGKLTPMFTDRVFFQAQANKCYLCHLDKDIKKEIDYDSAETMQFRDELMRDLESCFPGVRSMFFGTKKTEVTEVVNDLAAKFKYSEEK